MAENMNPHLFRYTLHLWSMLAEYRFDRTVALRDVKKIAIGGGL